MAAEYKLPNQNKVTQYKIEEKFLNKLLDKQFVH